MDCKPKKRKHMTTLSKDSTVTIGLLILLVVGIVTMTAIGVNLQRDVQSHAEAIVRMDNSNTTRFTALHLATQNGITELSTRTDDSITTLEISIDKKLMSLSKDLSLSVNDTKVELAQINLTLSTMLEESRMAIILNEYKSADRWSASAMTRHDAKWLAILQEFHPELHHSDVPDVRQIQDETGYFNRVEQGAQ